MKKANKALQSDSANCHDFLFQKARQFATQLSWALGNIIQRQSYKYSNRNIRKYISLGNFVIFGGDLFIFEAKFS
jgi:hypothetical protein